MKSTGARLRLGLVLLAWLAQLCLPVVHAAALGAPRAHPAGWCGDALQLRAVLAHLPAELRQAIDPDGVNSDVPGHCALFCGIGSTPALAGAAAQAAPSQSAADAVLPIARTEPHPREQAARPPAQAPPRA